MDILKYLYHKLDIKKDFDETFEYVDDRPFNDKLKELGWVENYTFEDAIEKTIEWYKEKYTSENDIE